MLSHKIHSPLFNVYQIFTFTFHSPYTRQRSVAQDTNSLSMLPRGGNALTPWNKRGLWASVLARMSYFSHTGVSVLTLGVETRGRYWATEQAPSAESRVENQDLWEGEALCSEAHILHVGLQFSLAIKVIGSWRHGQSDQCAHMRSQAWGLPLHWQQPGTDSHACPAAPVAHPPFHGDLGLQLAILAVQEGLGFRRWDGRWTRRWPICQSLLQNKEITTTTPRWYLVLVSMF